MQQLPMASREDIKSYFLEKYEKNKKVMLALMDNILK